MSRLRYLQSGMAVTDVGLAVNEKYKNANGEWIEEVTFVDVTVWGRTAEVMSEYLSKGSPVFIEGRLKLDSWEKDGQKRSRLKVTCEKMQLIGAKGQGGQGAPQGGTARPAGRPAPQRNQESQYNQAPPPDEAYDAGSGGPSGGGDDIPF